MAPLAFEVLRFRAAPANADAALLELDGRFTADPARELPRPRMVLELAGHRVEAQAVSEAKAVAAPEGEAWRASYLVPLTALDASSFALAVGRSLVLDLPHPDLVEADGSDASRHLRLAREANELRHRLDRTADERAMFESRLSGEREERERLEGALVATRARLAALERTRSDAEAERSRLAGELSSAREQHEHELTRARAGAREDAEAEASRTAEELAALRREHDADAERHAIELEALRGELERARAELEGLRAERERAASEPGPEPPEEPAAGPEHEPAEPPTDEAREDPTAETRAEPAVEPDPTEPFVVRRGSRPPATARVAPAGQRRIGPIEAAPGEGGVEESVRVLGSGRRRRHTFDDEPEPTYLPPGVAEVGARHIEPVGRRRSAARTAVVLAVVILLVALIVLVVTHPR